MTHQHIGERLHAFMKQKGLTQASLAKQSGVSQASVCRALKVENGKVGPALEIIFIFSGIDEYLKSQFNDPRERVLLAFDQIWDGTQAHAESIARVIGAMADLRPQPRKDWEN